MPHLHELDAEFLKLDSVTPIKTMNRLGKVRGDADGVMFLCPKCFVANAGPVGVHSVICWFRGVDPEMSPKPGRWDASGSTIDDLTLTPSVHLSGGGGCGWHGFVTNGRAE